MLTSKIISTLKQTNFSAINKTIQLNTYLRSALNVQNVRQLFSKSTLGLDGFAQTCQTAQMQFENIGENFKAKMSESIQEGNKHMVFTEDLKNMIYISTDDKDLQLVVTMIKKFNQQNKELRFGSFIFGPVVMRLFYHHNRSDLAVECFKSPELDGFFDQIISYQLLLDLLYETKKFQEVLEIVDLIKQKQLEGIRYPRNVVVLTLAACYKLNNKESLEYALNLWQELKDVGHFPMRRATTFCAGLAFNQGNPGVALEILTGAKNQSYTTVRNLKVAALAGVGRVENAIPILKSVFAEDTPGGYRHTFNKDVLDKVREAVTALDNPEIALEFNRIEQLLLKQGQISDMTTDEQLCQEIKAPAMQPYRRNFVPRYDNQSYSRSQNSERIVTKKRFYAQRPGLDELV